MGSPNRTTKRPLLPESNGSYFFRKGIFRFNLLKYFYQSHPFSTDTGTEDVFAQSLRSRAPHSGAIHEHGDCDGTSPPYTTLLVLLPPRLSGARSSGTCGWTEAARAAQRLPRCQTSPGRPEPGPSSTIKMHITHPHRSCNS